MCDAKISTKIASLLRYKKIQPALNLPLFIARRITLNSKRTFSKLIVRIAVLAISLSLAVMILSLAIVKGFKYEIVQKVRGFAGDVQIVKYDLNASYENSPFVMSPAAYAGITHTKGVAYAQPFATKPGIINANNEVEGVVFKGVDRNFNWEYINSMLVAGNTIDFSDSAKAMRQILISEYTANRLKLKTGDEFIMYFVQNNLRPRKFEISGIYNVGVEDIDKTYVIGSIDLVRRLNNWNNSQVGGYEVMIKDFSQIDTLSGSIYENLDMGLRSYSIKENFVTVFQWLSLLDVNTQVILVLMLAVAVINMISALLIMILERTNMIGILKALGSSDASIRKIFLYNAAYLIGLGLLLGNILGLGLGMLQEYTQIAKLDQASYYVSYVPVQINWLDVLMLNAGTLILCMLVLIVPSMLVSRITPVKAIAFK